MSLEEKLAALRAEHAEIVPEDVQRLMHRATEEIREATSGDVLEAGDKIPEFTLPNLSGEPVSSAGLLRPEGLVLTFYRGVW